MTDQREPRTEAGRRLLDAISGERRYFHRVEVAPDDIAAILATPEPALDVENRVYRIVERAANMGGCSQTHHEHLLLDARKVLVALGPAATPEPALDDYESDLPIRQVTTPDGQVYRAERRDDDAATSA